MIKTIYITLLILFLTTLSNAQNKTTIIPMDADWKYLVTPAAPDNDAEGDTWKVNAFDDTTWPIGAAQLGYGNNGDGDQTTIGFGGDSSNKYRTTYFRKSFTATAANLADLTLHIDGYIDDGVVIYLNGAEIWRDNIASGAVEYATKTITDYEGGFSASLTNSLVLGTNVLSAELHQVSSSSSDLSFNLQLATSTDNTNMSDEVISTGSNWKYSDLGAAPDNDTEGDTWKQNTYNDASWASGNAQLGYGESDQATVISKIAKTAYFRKEFNLTKDQAAFTYVQMSALVDDGMVVYLNGNEVWRDNLPSGAIDYGTFARTDYENTQVEEVITSTLLEGKNTIAVEVHQLSLTSSDISFDFELKVSAQITAELKRAPYLQKGSSNAMTIKYRTSADTETIINYGTSLGSLNSIASDNTLKSDHEIEITGLLPDTKYYYEIAYSSGVFLAESSDLFFKTAPEVGSDQFVRAWILGDAGTGNQNQKNVRDRYYDYVKNAATKNPNQTDMMLFLGDNAYNDGLDVEYQRAFFDIYEAQLKNTVSWSTLGNHDGYSSNSNSQTGPYYDIFTFPTAAESGGIASGTEAYYSFDYANIHFIVLESYTLDEDATQIAWCKQDMQDTKQDWIVAVFHHPPYSKGSHDSDNESELINMRTKFLPILEDNGVDLVLNGHSHSYERSFFINKHYGNSDTFSTTLNTVGVNGNLSGKADTADGAYKKTNTQNPGAVYITTGSAGKISGGDLDHEAMYSSLNELGSCVLEIDSDGGSGQNLTIKFINDSGSVSDYFTINKTGVTLSTKVNKLEDNDVRIYPVPVNGILNIEVTLNQQLKTVNIYNIVGELVKTTTRDKINLSTLTKGTYVVQIITDKGDLTKSIVIE